MRHYSTIRIGNSNSLLYVFVAGSTCGEEQDEDTTRRRRNNKNKEMNTANAAASSTEEDKDDEEWTSNKQKSFEKRFQDLMAFRAEFGHCNVPKSSSNKKNSKYYSLGLWCSHIRISYRTIKRGGKPREYKLTTDQIDRLENAGFDWNPSKGLTFEQRFEQLMAFKAEFGHCNITGKSVSTMSKYKSLGAWCDNMRMAYRAVERGEKPGRTITNSNIERLNAVGFVWKVYKTTNKRK